MKVLWFTSWYDEKNHARAIELLTCIQKVHDHPDISHIYILAETSLTPENVKVTQIPIDHRPTYTDFFNLANSVSEPSDILIIANIDIYPDINTIQQLSQLTPKACYALTRWNMKGSVPVFLNRRDSQDVWVFRGPIKSIFGEFPLGIPGCDNRIAHEIKEAGYIITNPSRQMKFIHLHSSGVRNYTRTDTTPKPYLLLQPC